MTGPVELRVDAVTVPDAGRAPAGPAGPSISVVICAYTADRWRDMVAAYASVTPQLGAADELLFVIDHNDDLLETARAELRGCRVIASTGPPGLSGARNTGVEASRADVVAFLDDDAAARPGWLHRLRSAFRDETVAVVGTAVEPNWQGRHAPRWFPAEFGWVVGCGYRGLPTERAAVRNPIGASMAVRSSAFAAAGGFSTALGRTGTLPAGCEETEFCIRVSSTLPQATIIFEPAAAVDHFVPAGRQTLRYFVRRCFHEGRSKRIVARLAGSGTALSAERSYVRVVLPAAVARGLSPRVLRRDPAAILRASMVITGLAATVAGFVTGSAPRRPGDAANARRQGLPGTAQGRPPGQAGVRP